MICVVIIGILPMKMMGLFCFSDYRKNLTQDGLENYYEYSIYTTFFAKVCLKQN